MLDYNKVHELIALVHKNDEYTKTVLDVGEFLTTNIIRPAYEYGKKDAIIKVCKLIENSVHDE